MTTSKRWIESGPLVPWMIRYAIWLVENGGTLTTPGERRMGPTTSQRTAFAGQEAKRKMHAGLIRSLELREDFRAEFEKLRVDAIYRARQVSDRDLVFAMEARGAALRSVANKQRMPDGSEKWVVGDPETVDKLTRPYVDVVYPKKANEAEKPPTVVIHLGGANAAKALGLTPQGLLPAEVTDVEYEVVENPKQLGAGDDE